MEDGGGGIGKAGHSCRGEPHSQDSWWPQHCDCVLTGGQGPERLLWACKCSCWPEVGVSVLDRHIGWRVCFCHVRCMVGCSLRVGVLLRTCQS
jgi:hypothetical protein